MTRTEDQAAPDRGAGDQSAGDRNAEDRDAGQDGRRHNRRRGTQVVLLRPVPGTSVIHRLWAGTKVLAVVALGLVLSFEPSWATAGLIGALAVVGVVLARIPAGARPRLGAWWAVGLAVGALLTTISGGSPVVVVAGLHIGLGDLDLYARFLVLAVELFLLSALVGWTTPLGELAPALTRLGRPLRWVRLPVDEWAVTIALCIRSLPLLMEEMRVLAAARRLRPAPVDGRLRRLAQLPDEAGGLLVAGLASALRRAGEMGEAIAARGGVGAPVTGARGPGRADWAVLAVVAVVCVAGATLGQLTS